MASTSIHHTSSGSSVTENFQSNDTLVITVTAANYGTGISASVTPSGACTASSTTVSMGSSVTITPSGTGSYSVFFFIYGGKGGTSNSGTVSGTISSGSSYTAPVISSVTNDGAAAANVTATVNLSSNGSGGTLQYAQTTTNSVPSTGWQSGNTFSHPRGTTRYYWASQATNTSGAYSSSVSHAVGYIAPDTAVSATSSTIGNTATSASTTLSNATSGETYAVRVNNGSTNLATRTGDGTLTWTSSLPTEGNTTTYEIFALRPTSIGGSGAYVATDDTFTVTRSSFAGATYYVDVTVTADLEINTLFMVTTGTGVQTSSQNPLLLTAGDRVGFRYGSNDGSTITASAFNTGYWTNTGSLTLTTSYQYKYAASGLSITVPDAVNITATRSGYTGTTNTLYYMGDSEQPDITISLDNSVYEISSTDTSHTIVISDSGSSTNSSITEYRARSGATTFQSRTGPGSLTVNDVPPNDGFPKYYYLDARVTTANGGSGLYENVPGSSYSVIATTTQSSNSPTIDTYGIAIYDHNGNAITSFNGGHTTLREIYSNSSVTLSTTGTTDVSTGLTGITTSNCVIMVEGSGASGATSAVNVPATFVGTNPVSVRLGRVSSAQTVKVTVAQHKGSTIGATNSFGFEVTNGDNDTVIDESSIVYGVKEVIALNPAASNQTLYQNDTTYFLYVELTQGAYPASGGIPIPAISSSKSVYLMPPSLTGTKHTDGSYKTVICYIPKAGTINGYYNLAMLVSADNATPSYYGGSAPSYGITISDSSSSLIWHSAWRQAIVNNVIVANQFTAGTNQNGTYDVTTGYDGVTAPLITSTEFPFGMESTGQVKGLTSLNDMDPANTYLAGSSLTGSVAYYMGFWEDFEHNQSGYSGGGLHKPAVKITGFSTANITMYRYSQGPTPPTSNDYGARLSTSYHPEGNYILFRIV